LKVMLDTDTCIFFRRQPAGFRPRQPLRDCGISVVVLGELEWGVARSRRVDENEAALRDFVSSVQVVELDAEVARQYGRLRAHLHAIGRPIGPNDLWIAAHALARGVPLITHNLSEFQRVPDLSVDTWMTA
jgi:tRNA(fMet)-specific endonuclease VapC